MFSSARRGLRILALGLLAAWPHLSSADLFYKVEKAIKLTDLNPAANGSIPFSVTGLNNASRMIGYFPSSNANKLHAFVWDNATHLFTDLNNLLNADSSLATCINDNGTVAGVYWESVTYAKRGFVYYPDGVMSTFSSPDGAGGSIVAVTAINARGDLIGTYQSTQYGARGFLLQQTGGSALLLDLGVLEIEDYSSDLWPTVLNNAGQVAGNLYFSPQYQGPPLTEAFLWDGGISLIDVSALGWNWTAVSLNNWGQVAGICRTTDGSGAYFSYLWDGNGAVGLSGLEGGTANAFSIRDNGLVYSTSLAVDGSLHLARSDGRTTVDLGSVSMYEGDLSFRPTGLSLTSVVDWLLDLPQSEILDFAGFGTDVAGHTRAMLWKDDGMHSVMGLMPAYLSFAAISNVYGSKVLVNNREQIACAGKDASGQQMALLLSIDPDTDNDGLPDAWEMQYYGHLGVNKDDPAAAGGGLTNWQTFQQGLSPNDFFNGQAPQIAIVSGNNQQTAPTGFVSLPLVVRVSNANGLPAANVPVQFTVSGEGWLQRTNVASAKRTVSINTDAGGQARVFFQVSARPNVPAQVYAQVTAGAFTAQTHFDERSDGGRGDSPDPTPPGGGNHPPDDPNDPDNPMEVPV